MTTISGASSAPSTSATPRTMVIPCRRTLPSSKSSTPMSRREARVTTGAAPTFGANGAGDPAPSGRRKMFDKAEGWVEAPVYERTALPTGFEIPGPAIIEQLDSTTLLVPGSSARVDERFNLICTSG